MKRLTVFCLFAALWAGAYAQVASPPSKDAVHNQSKALRYAEDRKPALTDRQKSLLEQSIAQRQETRDAYVSTALRLCRQGSPVQGKSQLTLKQVRPVESNVTRVTLDVQIDWQDGSGYQLLLDPDCKIYNLIGEASYEEIYDEADYKIPTDAGYLSSSLTIGEKESIDIPGGEYDFLVFNPAPNGDGSGSTYTANGLGAGDDITFENGYEYIFTVTKTGSTDNCAITSDSPVNLAIEAIKSPRSSAALSAAENVTVTIANNGTAAVSQFTASYTINNGTPVTETVDHELQPGDSFDYTFTAKADLTSGGPFTIKVSIEAEGDVLWSDNVISTEVEDLSPRPAPYSCVFNSEEAFNEWDIINANNDSQTWRYNETKKAAEIIYSATLSSDDYLITGRPIALEAGTNNIVVNYNANGSSYTERMELLYGSTPYVEEMTVIGSFIDFVNESEPHKAIINIEDMEAGNYYFALHAISEPNKFGISVYDVTISNGIYAGAPDISVDRVMLPNSSCSLTSDEYISVQVSNAGEGIAEGFTLNCKINGEEFFSQSFDIEMKPGDVTTVTFGIPADFSAAGVYNVEITATDIIPAEGMKEESNTTNNTASASVTHFTPAELPFAVDFSDEEQRSQWTSDSSWEYGTNGAANCLGTSPLISRGINLKKGTTYSLTYNYMAGADYMFFVVYENYSIICGPDGEDPSTWETLETYNDIYTEGLFTDNKIYFTVPEDGIYSLGFVQDDPQGTFSLKSVKVTEATQYDIRINDITGMPTMLPINQAGSMTLGVPVTNNGSEPVSGTVTVTADDATVGTATFENMLPEETWNIQVAVNMSSVELGETLFNITAEIDGHEDATPENNSSVASINITENVYAYDHVTNDMYLPYYAAGADGQEATIGLVFNIYTPTLLKAISAGWGLTEGQDISLHVFKWNPMAIPDSYGYLHADEEIYTSTVNQGNEVGQIDYELDEPLQLDKGSYMLAVSYTNPMLIVDNVVPGQLYMLSRNAYGEWIASDMSGEPFGTAAIRAILDDTATSINSAESAEASLSLYPNPVSTTLTITCGGTQLESVAIYSASGALICSETACGSEFSYDVSGLTPGVYFAKVSTVNGTETKKFVVK